MGLVFSFLVLKAGVLGAIYHELPHTAWHGSVSQAEAAQDVASAYRVSIPSLSIEAPVIRLPRTYWDAFEWEKLEIQMQEALTRGVIAYPHSAEPGQKGSLILVGHSSPPHAAAAKSEYGRVFADVPTLRAGDAIILQKGGAVFRYIVRDAVIVPAEDTSILKQQSKRKLLTLITCYPVGTTDERFVVTAELEE